jgi:hypothetical protein
MKKVIDLYENMSIYYVHVDELRERDINAQVQTQEVFDRLKTNIEIDKRLESIPLCYFIERPNNKKELGIISGHHRVRAARMANIVNIYVLVIENELSEAEIISKQLAHNSLNGQSNKQTIKELMDKIDSVEERLKSGVVLEKTKEIYDKVKVDEVGFDFNYEILRVVFLETQFSEFNKALELIDKNEKTFIANYADFDKISEEIRNVSKREDIRNIAALLTKMAEIVKEYYAEKDEIQK